MKFSIFGRRRMSTTQHLHMNKKTHVTVETASIATIGLQTRKIGRQELKGSTQVLAQNYRLEVFRSSLFVNRHHFFLFQSNFDRFGNVCTNNFVSPGTKMLSFVGGWWVSTNCNILPRNATQAPSVFNHLGLCS